jgi:hypothetical protein
MAAGLPVSAKALLESCLVEKPVKCLRVWELKFSKTCSRRLNAAARTATTAEWRRLWGACVAPFEEARAAMGATVHPRHFSVLDPKSARPQDVAAAIDTLFDGAPRARRRRHRK